MKKKDTVTLMPQKDYVYSLLFSMNNDPMFHFAFNCLKEKHQQYKPIFLKASKGGFFTKVEFRRRSREREYNVIIVYNKCIFIIIVFIYCLYSE